MSEGGHTSLVERIARILCAAEQSANAEGSEAHAGAHVDAHWTKHRNQALAVLKGIRESDPAGAAAGDPATWTRMVEASIAAADYPSAKEKGRRSAITLRRPFRIAVLG